MKEIYSEERFDKVMPSAKSLTNTYTYTGADWEKVKEVVKEFYKEEVWEAHNIGWKLAIKKIKEDPHFYKWAFGCEPPKPNQGKE